LSTGVLSRLAASSAWIKGPDQRIGPLLRNRERQLSMPMEGCSITSASGLMKRIECGCDARIVDDWRIGSRSAPASALRPAP